jgi:hypothetical protein
MKAEEEPLWFRRSNDHWQVGSDWEVAGSDADVRRAACEFIDAVKTEVRKSLGVHVGRPCGYVDGGLTRSCNA